MQIINFTVTNQTITPDCINRVVVAGAKDLVYAQFALDAEWSGLTVVALFSNDFYNNGQAVEQLWTGEPVEIPPEVLVTGRLRIGLNGFGADGSLMLPTVYIQNGIRVYRNGGLVAMQPETTTPALWEQVMAAMGRLSDLNTTDKSTLVAAINEVLSKAGTGGGAAIDPDAIAQAVEDYLEANPPAQGEPGAPGQAATLQIAGAIALEAGAAPTVTEQPGSTAQARIYSLGIPEGKDGTPGKDGEPGQAATLQIIGVDALPAGSAPTVTEQDGSTEKNRVYRIGVPSGKDGADGQPGAPGKDGADGYTPVRGTDYWTADDQKSIVSDVLAALPTWEGGSY